MTDTFAQRMRAWIRPRRHLHCFHCHIDMNSFLREGQWEQFVRYNIAYTLRHTKDNDSYMHRMFTYFVFPKEWWYSCSMVIFLVWGVESTWMWERGIKLKEKNSAPISAGISKQYTQVKQSKEHFIESNNRDWTTTFDVIVRSNERQCKVVNEHF